MELRNGKVAFVTDDGITISSHFGRAMYYEIITIENSTVSKRERIPKAGHHQFANVGDHGDHKHGRMSAPITDCAMLVARGMGMGAHQHFQQMEIRVALTDLKTIDDALAALTSGSLDHNEKRLHDHGPGHQHQG